MSDPTFFDGLITGALLIWTFYNLRAASQPPGAATPKESP